MIWAIDQNFQGLWLIYQLQGIQNSVAMRHFYANYLRQRRGLSDAPPPSISYNCKGLHDIQVWGFFSPNLLFETTEKHTDIFYSCEHSRSSQAPNLDVLNLHSASRLPPKLPPQELLVFPRMQPCVCGDWRRCASPPLDPWRPLAPWPRPSTAKVRSRHSFSLPIVPPTKMSSRGRAGADPGCELSMDGWWNDDWICAWATPEWGCGLYCWRRLVETLYLYLHLYLLYRQQAYRPFTDEVSYTQTIHKIAVPA